MYNAFTTTKEPRAWLRVGKNRMVSGPYTVVQSAGTWLCWFGPSDQQHRAKLIGRFLTADEGYAAAERHALKL